VNDNVAEAKRRAAEAHADLTDAELAAVYDGAVERMCEWLNDSYHRARLVGNRSEQIAHLMEVAA